MVDSNSVTALTWYDQFYQEFISERAVFAIIIELTAGAQGYHKKGIDVLNT